MNKITPLDLSSLAFVETIYIECRKINPQASTPAIEGVALRVMMTALDAFKQNEQLSKGSYKPDTKLAISGFGPLPKTRETRWEQTSSEGLRQTNQGTTTRNNRKKRRSKKA
jgi:hypothetical protein